MGQAREVGIRDDEMRMPLHRTSSSSLKRIPINANPIDNCHQTCNRRPGFEVQDGAGSAAMRVRKSFRSRTSRPDVHFEQPEFEDLKSSGAKAPCGFDPRPRHSKIRRRPLPQRAYSAAVAGKFKLGHYPRLDGGVF